MVYTLGMNSFEDKSTRSVSGIYQEFLLQKFAPPCILINLQEKVLLINGEIERYLTVANKEPGPLLADFVDKNMYQKLVKGIREVAQGEESVLIDGRTFEGSAPFYVYITPFVPTPTAEKLILIEFEDADEENVKNATNNLVATELHQQYEDLLRTTEHDIRNLVNNVIMLLNLEEDFYPTNSKIHDVKELQERLLSTFKQKIEQLKAMLHLPSSDV